jgi:TDG/mug DNA glycosylase family protein
LDLTVCIGDGSHRPEPDDDQPARPLTRRQPPLHDLLVGAGFEPDGPAPATTAGRAAHGPLVACVRRARTLPDTVGAGMRLLFCGLNPSLYAADAGVGFARPGNRFWPAALAAGLVSVDRDPDHALRHHGIGMTDLVKRATVSADELTTAEYRSGLARVERLARLAPTGRHLLRGAGGVESRGRPSGAAGPASGGSGGSARVRHALDQRAQRPHVAG